MNDKFIGGISEEMIKLRDEFNRKISSGFCMFKGVEIDRAFISNIRSYYKVFLLGLNRQMFEYGISPELLTKKVKQIKE